ncbi:MAG: TolC family protein [Flavitalea sp.]
MKKFIIVVLAVYFISADANAQQATYIMNLNQCIDSALRKNIVLQQARLSHQTANVNVHMAKTSQLPAVTGTVGQGINLGRNVDPFNNQYANQTINYGSYGVSGDMIIYNGGNIKNNIKRTESNAVAAREDLRLTGQQTVLNVILAYMQVLSTQEQLEMTRTQAKLSEEQLTRLKQKSDKGVVAPSQVSDLQGQLLNDQLAIVDLQNTLEWYKMELAQQMNIPYNKQIKLIKIDIDKMLTEYAPNNVDIYETAMENFPQIRAAKERSKGADYALKSARGLRYPQLFAGGTVGTVYTSSAETTTGKLGFSNQFLNNRAANFNVGIRIPILASNVRNNIKLADITLENVKLEEERTKNVVWQEIERGYVAMTNAYKRFRTLEEQLIAYRQSYKAAEARFVTGVDNSLDYLLSKNNLDRANINFINARYDFILKKKVLDFYQNIP